MICPSCGGVVGRDCFNPEECMWITQQMAAEYQRMQQEQHAEMYYIERARAEYEAKLEREYYAEQHAQYLLDIGFDPIALGM